MSADGHYALLEEMLNVVLPDSKIIDDLTAEIHGRMGGVVPQGATPGVAIPADATFPVLFKMFLKEYYEGVGCSAFKVMIAVGGVESVAHGVVQPKYCFATLRYSRDVQLISADFHSERR